ncbi:MAG: hypothetical protein WAN86_02915, partial [Hyphomicrobiaceae bacterium]
VEYRLACSGEFYNRKVTTFDWRKSDATRLLLAKPFSLQVASRPFDSYPQELCMRFTVGFETEQTSHTQLPGSTFTSTFLPDEDIVEDVCAVLTLLSRRLITTVVKTMQTPGIIPPTQSWPLQSPVPMPIVGSFKVGAWPRRPLTITTTMSGQTVTFNEPPPVGVDHEALGVFLADLGRREGAQGIVYAAKQYKTALELIVERPETAYLALVSVIETLASGALPTYEPEESERIAIKANVAKKARTFGLDEPQSHQLALEATKGDRWLKRRFVRFCKNYCPMSELSGPDPLFMLPDFLKPSEADFESCLKQIYDARSKNLHVAVPFPPGTDIGTSLGIKARYLPLALSLALSGKLEIPPVTWFERVVSIASRRYLIGDAIAPFVDLSQASATSAEA